MEEVAADDAAGTGNDSRLRLALLSPPVAAMVDVDEAAATVVAVVASLALFCFLLVPLLAPFLAPLPADFGLLREAELDLVAAEAAPVEAAPVGLVEAAPVGLGLGLEEEAAPAVEAYAAAAAAYESWEHPIDAAQARHRAEIIRSSFSSIPTRSAMRGNSVYRCTRSDCRRAGVGVAVPVSAAALLLVLEVAAGGGGKLCEGNA